MSDTLRINMGKFFDRAPSLDFNDDGTRFIAYTFGDFRITKAVDGYNIYIKAEYTDHRLTYDEQSELPHYDGLGRLNCISKESFKGDSDLEQLKNDMIAFETEYVEKLKTVKTVTTEEYNRAVDEYNKPIEEGSKLFMDFIRDHAFDIIMKAEDITIRDIKYAINTDIKYAKKKRANGQQDLDKNIGQASARNFIAFSAACRNTRKFYWISKAVNSMKKDGIDVRSLEAVYCS